MSLSVRSTELASLSRAKVVITRAATTSHRHGTGALGRARREELKLIVVGTDYSVFASLSCRPWNDFARLGSPASNTPRHPSRSPSLPAEHIAAMADRIKEVWTTNLEEEMSYLRAAIEKYPFVAMVSPSLPASFTAAGPLGLARAVWKSSVGKGVLISAYWSHRIPSSPVSSHDRSARFAGRAITTTRPSGVTSTCSESSNSA